MATLSKETKKRKFVNKPKPQTPNKKTKKTKTLEKQQEQGEKQHRRGGESDSDGGESESEKLSTLLEVYSKEHLIELISDAAAKDPSLFGRVRDLADRDVAHRKIFVHGLGWDTAKDAVAAAFEQFGEIEECNVVLDKATGKAKGYGFVLFKTRRSAIKALKTPQKKINGRLASCQLASLGHSAPAAAPSAPADSPAAGRKIYVSNVPAETDVVKFRDFFARFGELEAGPIGFDVQTGKSRGFALFVYRTAEGFKKALQEPYKTFQGHQLHCQKAAEGKGKSLQPPPKPAASPQPPAPAPAPRPMPQQNFGFFNPMMYGVGAGFVPGAMNPLGMVPVGQFGPYGVGGSAANPNASGLPQVYPGMSQFGAGGGSTGAYPSSYVW